MATIMLIPLLLIAAMPAAPGRTFASEPRTCAVLQAALKAAAGATRPTWPAQIRLAWRDVGLDQIMPAYAQTLPLSAQELAGLTARQPLYDAPAFRPACRWRGQRASSRGRGTGDRFVTITSPIVSADGRLAITEVSFRSEGWGGHGSLCVARQGASGWTARCVGSWIT